MPSLSKGGFRVKESVPVTEPASETGQNTRVETLSYVKGAGVCVQ